MNRQLLFEPTEMALHIVPVYRVQKEIGEDLWGISGNANVARQNAAGPAAILQRILHEWGTGTRFGRDECGMYILWCVT